jgi:hypothetical protein
LASSDPTIATGIVFRMRRADRDFASELASTDPTTGAGIVFNMRLADTARDVDFPIVCRLLSETSAGRVRLEQRLIDFRRLEGPLRRPCGAWGN